MSFGRQNPPSRSWPQHRSLHLGLAAARAFLKFSFGFISFRFRPRMPAVKSVRVANGTQRLIAGQGSIASSTPRL